ncbi:hypothetical protein [uncultured Desulfosarcina sp.]|uniref:hypothetical protein n=1 Tax=uncultured Desulfosarcina sp. TaxID=218289 RepID=UPI0029C8131E|nr:hypothetical protein [uncultured Desulfosarcina sp.]
MKKKQIDGITKAYNPKTLKQATFNTMPGLHEVVKRYCQDHNIKMQDFYTEAVVDRLMKIEDRDFIVKTMFPYHQDQQQIEEVHQNG